jgi:DNA-binding beta-propeller fold protein YncE
MRYIRHFPIALILMLIAVSLAQAGDINVAYLYNLSDFDGTIPYNAARTFADDKHGEIYVVTSGGVDIYNSSGMQTFHFDYDRELGGIYDAAVDDKGNILLLGYKDGEYLIVHCNYRGDPKYSVKVGTLPPEFEGFRPGRMLFNDGRIYLVSQADMRAVIIEADGSFIAGYDFAVIFNMNDQQRMDNGIDSFNLDPKGNMLFTIPSLGRGEICTPDGTITEFGKRGSGPGKFGVPSGIAADANGNLLVTDKLRGVVMIFDKNLNYIKEFGFRGLRPGNLIVPSEITIDRKTNRVYVSQMRRRGVNIYQLSYDQ